jgi:hypothetical protein
LYLRRLTLDRSVNISEPGSMVKLTKIVSNPANFNEDCDDVGRKVPEQLAVMFQHDEIYLKEVGKDMLPASSTTGASNSHWSCCGMAIVPQPPAQSQMCTGKQVALRAS